MAKYKHILLIVLIVLVALACLVFLYFEHYAPLSTADGTVAELWYSEDELWRRVPEAVLKFNTDYASKHGFSIKTRAFASEDELGAELYKRINSHGILPDMVICDTDLAAFLDKSGVTCEMNDYFSQWETADFDDSILAASTVDGKLIAVPLAFDSAVFIADKELVKDEENVSSLEKLCAASPGYYEENGKGFFTISDYSVFFRSYVARLGGDFDGRSPHDTDDENSKYIYKLLAETAYARGYAVTDEAPARLVADGTLPCAFVSASDVAENAAYIDPDSVLIMPYPGAKGGSEICPEQLYGIVILNSDISSIHASAMFSRWFSTRSVNDEFVKGSGYVPSSYEVYDENDNAVLDALYKMIAEWKANGLSLFPTPDAAYPENSRSFNEVLNTIMNSLS